MRYDNVGGRVGVGVELNAGRRTPPIRMSIDRLNIVDDLSAAFRFPRTGSIGAGERIPAVLTVRNDSAHTIRFRKRGYSSTGVSMRVISPRRHDGRFYPAEKLLGRSPVGLPSLSDIDFVDDRDAGRRAATIVLPPGEVFTRELPLEEAYDFKAGTQYEVTLWSMFSFYVAEKDGPYAEYNPIRVEATGTGRFEIVP